MAIFSSIEVGFKFKFVSLVLRTENERSTNIFTTAFLGQDRTPG